ncbi:MAG: hypothetical protein HQ488_00920 [Parcubacteria group bacterium]|nr:hypothetical protein [Parcubacteria group bacterium]
MSEQDQDQVFMRAMGERLALLLAAADIPDEVKESFVAMVPDMTPDQIAKLMQGLEARVGSGENEEVAQLKQAVEKVQEQHEAAVKASEDKAIGAMQKIEDLLKEEEA